MADKRTHSNCACFITQVRGTVVDLAPGDTLLVPAYWFAHTQLFASHPSPSGAGGGAGGRPEPAAAPSAPLQGGSAALIVRLQAPAPAPATQPSEPNADPADGQSTAAPASREADGGSSSVNGVDRGGGWRGDGGSGRVLCDGALQLQCSRMVEAVVAHEVGAANVRRWLQVGGMRAGANQPVCRLACLGGRQLCFTRPQWATDRGATKARRDRHGAAHSPRTRNSCWLLDGRWLRSTWPHPKGTASCACASLWWSR